MRFPANRPPAIGQLSGPISVDDESPYTVEQAVDEVSPVSGQDSGKNPIEVPVAQGVADWTA